MKIKYLSHACFLIEENGTRIIIDPFLSANPKAPVNENGVDADYVLISHAHGDHMLDAFTIAKRCGSTIISSAEISTYAQAKGLQAHSLHIGGGYNFPFGRVKLTIAHHGSSIHGADGIPVNLGIACGFLITMGGKTVYHAGDTGLFLDMKLIGEMNRIDAALLPIGDNYTMGIDDAVKAVEFLNPKLAIPMHYDTFDVIPADPEEFVSKVKAAGGNAQVVAFGGEIEI